MTNERCLSLDFVLEKVSAPSHSLPVAEMPLRNTSGSHPPEMFKLLIEQIQDYAICLLDQKGNILTWNEGARRVRGYEVDDIVGKNFSVFYTPQDIEADKPRRELQLAEQIGKFEDEGWRLRKDGSRFWANVVITALRGTHGELLGFAEVTRDLTQRKIQEDDLQKLLESEERFKLLVEQVTITRFLFWTPKGMSPRGIWEPGGSKVIVRRKSSANTSPHFTRRKKWMRTNRRGS